jgi:hypothetical protein
MRCFTLLPAVVATALLPGALAGQRTADQARLIFSIGFGQTSGGGTIWEIDRQPFISSTGVTDTIGLSRGFRRNLAVAFSGTYFPGDHLGMTVEAQLFGLGTVDRCAVVATQGAQITSDLCNSINGSERQASTAAFSVGGIYRVGSRYPIHPFLRTNLGIAITEQSFIRTSGRSPAIGENYAVVPLYEDSKSTDVTPYLALGAGVVAVIGRGYQFHFEVRDNWVRIPAVTAPTIYQGFVPAHSTVGKHVWSFLLAFDVVLERKRGRRY